MDKQELLARLAEGHAAKATVVTPNARLSRALVLDFDSFQAGNQKTAWEAADILPFGAFVERLYEDALYSDIPGELPLLLTEAQEQHLWAEAIRAAPRELLSVERTAADCADAWRLMHAWRIGFTAGNDDVQAFGDWASAYGKRTSGEIDPARLPDFLVPLMPRLKLPKLLVAYAFDLLPPQARMLLDALAAQGVQVAECKPPAKRGTASRTGFSSAKEELERAAAWARARLEAGASRIGVVVPELQLRRREVVRVFSRAMRPGYDLPGAQEAPMPFNVSIGVPLAEVPVVALALSLLRFSREELPFPEVSALVRSPFLGGAETELGPRMRLDVSLRRRVEAKLGLPRLIAHVDGCPRLRGLLEKVFAEAREDLFRPQTPSDWARHFSALLDAAGFPGERGLDSAEFQARAKLNEMLGELSRIDRVSTRMSFAAARSLLERLCRETLFQPESPDAPVQVLGVLESAGLEFDHLWVAGLTDEAWPLQARANPFIPVALQRKAGIPEASPEGSLALDRRITAGWSTAAREVVFSWSTKDEDRSLAPSPLILDFPEAAPGIPSFPRLRDMVFSLRNTQAVEDRVAPAVTALKVKGGTKVLADQAACPFRAFARHRLGARELEAPVEGLDAAKRGSLLHAFMASLFSYLRGSEQLREDPAPFLAAAAADAVKELGLEGRFAELERARLARLGAEWLEVERSRPDFEVAALEEKRVLQFAGLSFEGRIDRMDRLAKGHALIDYKTSRAPSPKHWEPPRPEDPQLPLYAVSANEDITAVAFAKVRRGEMRLMGFSRDEDALPGVRKAKAWKPLLDAWKAEAESLGKSFASGEARVDPKRHLQTCRYCDLQTLCRVYEKVSVLAEEEFSSEEE